MLQTAFQRLPGEGFSQDAPCIQHQETAIGAVQRTGADQREIGHQRAHMGDILDPPHQAVERRQFLGLQRRARRAALGMRDHHVDHVSPELRQAVDLADPGGKGAIAPLGVGLEEQFRIADHVLRDLVQVMLHAVDPGETGPRLIDAGLHGLLGHAGMQGDDLLAMRPHQGGRAFDDRVQLFLKARDLFLDPRLFIGGQLVKRLFLDHLAIADRSHQEARGRVHDAHILGLGAGGEFLHPRAARLGEFGLQRLAPRLVIIRLEKRGDLRAKIVDKILHLGL